MTKDRFLTEIMELYERASKAGLEKETAVLRALWGAMAIEQDLTPEALDALSEYCNAFSRSIAQNIEEAAFGTLIRDGVAKKVTL